METQIQHSMWQLVSQAVASSSALELGILLFLALCSILSWALILMKVSILRQAQRNNAEFMEKFEQAQHSGEVLALETPKGNAIFQGIFRAAFDALEQGRSEGDAAKQGGPQDIPLKTGAKLSERIQLKMEHTSKFEFQRLNWGLDILATIGSSTPFIGLLGTVLGIMGTFQVLGVAKSASLNVVAPGISAALIATAAGLAVAIPSVAGYNWIMARIDEMQEQAGCFIERVNFVIRASGVLPEPTDGSTASKLPTPSPRKSVPEAPVKSEKNP